MHLTNQAWRRVGGSCLLVLGLLSTAVGAPAGAQELTPPLAPVLPLDLPHATPHGLELIPPPAPGRWLFALTTAYGNTFSTTANIDRAHLTVDGAGAALSPAAVAYAELNWPSETIYHLDAEVVRVEAEASRGLGRGWSAGARVGWWRLGGTGLDPLPERVHHALGIEVPGRELYPRGETTLVVGIPGRPPVLLDAGTEQLDNLGLWVTRELPEAGGLTHRLRVSLSVPTAGTTALGEPGWDVDLGWAGELGLGSGRLGGGLAWTHHGGTTLLGGPAADTLHAWMSFTLRLSTDVGLGVIIRGDGTPLADTGGGRLSERRGTFAVGPTFRLRRGLDLQLALGEDFPEIGVTPDFSIQARLLWH